MDPRSRPGKSSYGRHQTTLGRSSITTTTAGLVRQAATSGTRGDTGAITTAPCSPEVRPPGFTDRQPFPCNARLASAYPSDAQRSLEPRPLIPRPGLLLRAAPPNYPLTDRLQFDIL